jgi:hypothetical protein
MLLDLLAEMDELPAMRVIGKLQLVPVLSTRQLLELAREQWFGDRGRCFVSGCAGVRDPLDRHLRNRWGTELGALAVQAPRGPPSRAGPRPTVLDTFEALADFARGDS